MLNKNLVDEIHLFKSKIIIGKHGKPAIVGKKLSQLNLSLNERKIQRRHIYKLSGELMFTGIIQDLGTIKNKDVGLYQISTKLDLSNCKEGSSISCNGVCLTAKNITPSNNNSFSFDVNIGEETLKRTNLAKSILKNENINLEKSLQIGDEISGHFVYGHVDTTTNVVIF